MKTPVPKDSKESESYMKVYDNLPASQKRSPKGKDLERFVLSKAKLKKNSPRHNS